MVPCDCGSFNCSRCTKAVGHGWPELERCQGCDRRLLKNQPHPETRWCEDCLKIQRGIPPDLLWPPEWGKGGCACVKCEEINNPKPRKKTESEHWCGWFLSSRWWLIALAVIAWALWMIFRRAG